MPEPEDDLRELLDLFGRAGLDRGVEPLLDALWLAGRVAPPEPAPARADRPPLHEDQGVVDGTAPATRRDDDTVAPSTDPERDFGLLPGPSGAPGLSSAPGPTGRAVRLPRATSVAHTLPLTRALRPLRGHLPPSPRYRSVLDIDRTVAVMAETGLPELVYRRVRRRDLRLRLLMEATPSMVVWQDLLEELAALCADTGAFREVRVEYLHTDGDEVRLSRTPRGAQSARPAVFPVADTLTLLLSDCTGSGWASRLLPRFLAQWAQAAPVAVLQPLPQRLWNRTGFPVSAARLRRDRTVPGGLTGQPVRRRGRDGPPVDGSLLPVPVLEPTAAALGAWSRLLTGSGRPEVLTAAGWVDPHAPTVPLPPAAPVPPPDEALAAFRLSASPDAFRLACYLASVPLWLPVMKVVQRAMLPDSGPADLAELLLSGLLVRLADQQPWDLEQWYEFRPGVRDALLTALARDEAELVRTHMADWVGENFGRGIRSFLALLNAQLGGGPPPQRENWPADPGEARMLLPFAQVSSQVVRRYLGPFPDELVAGAAADPVERARRLLARASERDGVRHVLAAVDILRRWHAEAVDGPAAAAAAVELAEGLLALWQETRDLTLLREAAELLTGAAETTGLEPVLRVRVLGLLGRTLHSLARVLLSTGLVPEARARLLTANRVLLQSLSASGTADRAAGTAETAPEEWKLLGERAEVLRDLWELDRAGALLVEAELLLRALVERAGQSRAQRVHWQLLLGRTLLDLAVVDPPGTAQREEAEVVLRAALATLDEAGELPGAHLGAGMLDLAEAVAHRAPPGDGELGDEVLPLVRRALEAAPADGPVSARAHEMLARRYLAGHEAGWPAEMALRGAAEAFDLGRRLYPRDHPEHTRLLAERGSALLVLAQEDEGAPRVSPAVRARAASEAVRVLRRAAADTGPGDPDYAPRQLALGRGLATRHELSGDLADLREAEYVTERAASSRWGEPLLAARAWFSLAELRLALFEFFVAGGQPPLDAQPWLSGAVRALRRAQSRLVDRQDPESMRLNALAAHRVGVVAELAGWPQQALEDYREAMELWRRTPDGGGQEGADTAAAISRITR